MISCWADEQWMYKVVSVLQTSTGALECQVLHSTPLRLAYEMTYYVLSGTLNPRHSLTWMSGMQPANSAWGRPHYCGANLAHPFWASPLSCPLHPFCNLPFSSLSSHFLSLPLSARKWRLSPDRSAECYELCHWGPGWSPDCKSIFVIFWANAVCLVVTFWFFFWEPKCACEPRVQTTLCEGSHWYSGWLLSHVHMTEVLASRHELERGVTTAPCPSNSYMPVERYNHCLQAVMLVLITSLGSRSMLQQLHCLRWVSVRQDSLWHLHLDSLRTYLLAVGTRVVCTPTALMLFPSRLMTEWLHGCKNRTCCVSWPEFVKACQTGA